MAWFFTKDRLVAGDIYEITGEDAMHISRSLRMKKGEGLTLCDNSGNRCECEISDFSKDSVTVRVLAANVCEQEPTAQIHLFCALMKGDKLDDVVKKAVELGASSLTPILTSRCVSRPDEKSLQKKLVRWQKISASAASQSRRGIIPTVEPMLDIRDLPKTLSSFDRAVVFYEAGGEPLRNIISPTDRKIALITGSEGGFEESEIKALSDSSVRVATLGKRILRAQTAPIAALCAAMFITGNLE